MTILPATSSPDIPIDQTQIPINEDAFPASDLDLGLQFFSEFTASHLPDGQSVDTVKLLIEQDAVKKLRLQKIEKSRVRWRRTKKVGIYVTNFSTIFTAVAGLLALFLASSSDNTTRQAITAIAVISIAIPVLAAFGTAIAWKYQGKRQVQLENETNLHEEDIDAVKKMRTVIEAWGAMKRAQQDETQSVDLDRKIKECFKKIQQLPEKASPTRQIPDKTVLASATITLLPNDHPLNQTISQMVSLKAPDSETDSDSGEYPSFHDIGQKDRRNQPTIQTNPDTPENRSCDHWKKMQHLMHGLYVQKLLVGRHQEIINPLSHNPFFPMRRDPHLTDLQLD